MRTLPCEMNDVERLALMNRMLIEDEKAENPMTLSLLENRMSGFLSGDYRAFFFQEDSTIVGYALVNTAVSPRYLRQFFICREQRRKGYGKTAFHALLEHLQIDTVDIDVYVWNETGVAFWKSLGFHERCYSMRFRQ